DTLVSIGGNDNDYNYGQGGLDSFWIDQSIYEQTDATNDEIWGARVHKVAGFINTPAIDPLGQDLPDPQCSKDAAYSDKTRLDGNPLFLWSGPSLNDVRQR